ncbi:hypothetical protein BJQ90_02386 [Arthrobacter sp. SO3]|nr:hypothetical protein [Arthrobacter sp. SO3]
MVSPPAPLPDSEGGVGALRSDVSLLFACSAFVLGAHGSVRTVVALGVLANFRPCGSALNRSGGAVVGLYKAPCFLCIFIRGRGQSSLAAGCTIIAFGVLSFVLTRVAAGLSAGLTVISCDIAAADLSIP